VWFTYTPEAFKGQHGVMGHVLGGWTFAPILDMGSGLPLGVYAANAFADGSPYDGGQTFGGMDASNFGSYDNAISMCGNSFSSKRHNNNINDLATYGTNGYGPTLFGTDAQEGTVYNCFRNPILGVDGGHNGGVGNLRGQAFWNVDFSIKKNLMVTERLSAEFGAVFTNIFNHNQLFDPFNALGDQGDFGALEGEVNNPRKIEVDLRVRF